MHRLAENMFVHSLRQDHFSNQKIKFVGAAPPFLYLKKCYIFSQIKKKRPSQTPVVAPFRDKYAPTSKKYVFTKAKARPFQ